MEGVMSTQIALEPLMTAREVAEVTRLARSTIYMLVCQGRIPHLKLGEAVRFRPSDVRAWLEAQAKPGRLQRVPSVEV
jgi:excisionase family DNA binding protein